MKPSVKLIVSLDTECDKGPAWKVRQPLSFLNIVEGIPDRLQPLFEKYGIKPTYLLSPEILKDDACVEIFRSLEGRAELGTHLHAEFIDPYPDWSTDNTNAFQSDFPPKIEFQKLKNLTELFENKIGRAPTSFRAGRFGMSNYTLGFLEELGYKVDSSVTPYTWWWRRKGEGINFLGAPDQPYHPSRNDCRKHGDMQILEVPITLTNPFWEKVPVAILLAINPINRLQTIFLNIVFKDHLRSKWLRPTYSTAKEMLAITKHQYHKTKGIRSVICMMFHSNEATPSMSPYNLTETQVNSFLERLNAYFEILFSRFDVQSAGLSDLVEVT